MNTVGPTSPACCTSSNLSAPVCPTINASKKARFEACPGFSQGTPDAKVSLNYRCILSLYTILTRTTKDENDVAAELVGFMQQFLEVFSELKGKKLYLTGESVRICLIQMTFSSS
jgi:hypothetical protein